MAARLAMLLGLVAAAACEPGAPPPVPPPSNAAAPPVAGRDDLPEEQRSPDLFGAWLVETLDTPGPAPAWEGGWDIVLLVGVRQLEILSQCITIGPFEHSRLTGGRIRVTQQTVRPSALPGLPAPVQCARMPVPAERALGPLLLAAERVAPHRSGAVIVSGPRGAIWLSRPAGALANPRGDYPLPRIPPLLGAWRFLSVDGTRVAEAERMELLLRPRHLEWRSGCVNGVRALRLERDRLLLGAIDPFPVCERGRSPAETAVERLFGGPVAARMSRDGRLTLAGSGVTAALAPLVR